MLRFLLPAALALIPSLASAQAQYIPGRWRCILHSVPATVDVIVDMAPDFTAYAEGTWILNQGPGMNGPQIREIRAPGRWAFGPLPGMPSQQGLHLQLVPNNVPSFTLYPAWIGDPGALRTYVPDGAYPGAMLEYACQRLR